MTGIVVHILRQHFADERNFEQDTFRENPYEAIPDTPWSSYRWRPTDRTGIKIESINKWRPKESNWSPALIVKRNKWAVQRRGINDMMQGTLAADGFDRYATFMSGSHTIFCVADEAGEAELLAQEVYTTLISFGPVIRRNLDLHQFLVMEVDSVMLMAEEATERFVVPVSIAYAHEVAWVLTQDVPRLRRITISTNLLRP